MERIEKTFPLTAESCDEIAMMITDFCGKMKTETKNALRYRLSAEECLLYWLDHLGEGAMVSLRMGRKLMAPFISLEARGETCNPYADEEKTAEFGSSGLLAQLGLKPEFSYRNGTNYIFFRIARKSLSQPARLAIVIVLALAVGLAGNAFLPETLRSTILDSVVVPIYNTFFRILNCIAGPMIFLSVAWGIYGIGDAETFGRIGRKVMLSYTGVVFLVTACCTVLFPILGLKLSYSGEQNSQLGAIVEMLLDIFPSNIIEPFSSGNTMQIIFLSIVVGMSLLFIGQRTIGIAHAIDQINYLVQFLMATMSKLVPSVIFLILVKISWSGELSQMSSVWKIVIIAILTWAVILTLSTLWTAWLQKVRIPLLVRKALPTFLVALMTASSAAAFNNNVSACEKKYGIDPSLVSFGIPLGLVIHKPITAAYHMVIVFFFAGVYGVSCSPVWILTAVIVSAVLAIALPPIPGGGAIVFAVLFRQMGIPEEALSTVLALDVLMDFILTAFEMVFLQQTFINTAAKLKMLDHEVLRS